MRYRFGHSNWIDSARTIFAGVFNIIATAVAVCVSACMFAAMYFSWGLSTSIYSGDAELSAEFIFWLKNAGIGFGISMGFAIPALIANMRMLLTFFLTYAVTFLILFLATLPGLFLSFFNFSFAWFGGFIGVAIGLFLLMCFALTFYRICREDSSAQEKGFELLIRYLSFLLTFATIALLWFLYLKIDNVFVLGNYSKNGWFWVLSGGAFISIVTFIFYNVYVVWPRLNWLMKIAFILLALAGLAFTIYIMLGVIVFIITCIVALFLLSLGGKIGGTLFDGSDDDIDFIIFRL